MQTPSEEKKNKSLHLQKPYIVQDGVLFVWLDFYFLLFCIPTN